MASPFVDYEAAAGNFARNRTLSGPGLDAWGRVVAPHLRGVDVAVDLAAGTGAFSAALRDWGADRVVAVEPSAAMQDEAPTVAGVQQTTGRAEAIPLRSRSAGLVWISTAFHHFGDLPKAVQECRRVLVHDGRVVIRGFVPGHHDLPWGDFFPGSDKAIARFPDLDEMNRLFAEAGFTLVQDTVVERTETAAARARFIERMRHADSILTALSDAEVDAGIAALRQRGDEVRRYGLSCLVYQRG